MSQIDDAQGAVRASEVGVDDGNPTFDVVTREDLNTVVSQIQKAVVSTVRKSEFLLISTGNILWDGTQIQSIGGADILLKIFANETVGAKTVTIPDSLLPVALAPGESWVLRVSRAQMQSSFTAAGGDLQVYTDASVPALSVPQNDASDDGFISYVIAHCTTVGSENYLWWRPAGIVWEPNKSAVLGTVTSSATVPVGGMIDIHTFGSPVYGDAQLDQGFKMCDGTVVTASASAYKNPNRDANGLPANPSFDPADDKFVPDLIGNYVNNWSSAVAYSAGDKVIRPLTTFVNNGDFRASSGTTKALKLSPGLKVATGERVVVASVGGSGYNGTFTITNSFEVSGAWVIQYTGTASSTEGSIANPAIADTHSVNLAAADAVALSPNTNQTVMNALVSETWSIGKSYSAGDRVYHNETNVNGAVGHNFAAYYVSLTNSNLGNNPLTSTSDWQPVWTRDFGSGSPFRRTNPQASLTSPATVGSAGFQATRLPTYRRGGQLQSAASSSAMYGGDNLHELTEDQLASHTHNEWEPVDRGERYDKGGDGSEPWTDKSRVASSTTGDDDPHNNEPRYFIALPTIRVF